MKKNFRRLLEHNRWLKMLPNALTLCNSLCGFSAILYTLHVYDADKIPQDVLAVSAWIILFAMIFDALDGFAARIFNAASMHGMQMDSLADMLTFGAAPAIMVAVMAHHMKTLQPYQYVIVWGFCAIYMGCAALRLATYNVHAIVEKKSGNKFTGLPSPGAAAALCSMVILYGTRQAEQIVNILPIYAAVLGFLMVSNIPYIHAAKWLFSVRRNKERMFILFVTFVAIYYFDVVALVFVINVYVLSGPLLALLARTGVMPDSATSPQHVEIKHNNIGNK